MTRVFVDTSAILALLVRTDAAHGAARAAFAELRQRDAALVTTCYVLVESYALLGRRVGLAAVEALRRSLVPLFETVWVDAQLHEQALDWLLARDQRDISLVDAVSFAVIRGRRIDQVLAYDRHFASEGFTLL